MRLLTVAGLLLYSLAPAQGRENISTQVCNVILPSMGNFPPSHSDEGKAEDLRRYIFVLSACSPKPPAHTPERARRPLPFGEEDTSGILGLIKQDPDVRGCLAAATKDNTQLKDELGGRVVEATQSGASEANSCAALASKALSSLLKNDWPVRDGAQVYSYSDFMLLTVSIAPRRACEVLSANPKSYREWLDKLGDLSFTADQPDIEKLEQLRRDFIAFLSSQDNACPTLKSALQTIRPRAFE